ncbi:MAG: hypothetical protein IPN71_13675 [Fibrobacteres bacterium]|nr:hypothetical protein [Fibrobacterota bacterium]
MAVVATIQADSYPVGMDLSPDGKWLVVTAQGHTDGGGNSVMVYRVETERSLDHEPHRILVPWSGFDFRPGCDGGNSTKASSEKDGYGSVADSLAASSDWVIDQCRVTYKGKPIPLGSAYPEIVAMFGPPDDSVIGDSGLAGRPRNYYWDKIGIEASAVVENDPAHYQLRILFREALPPPASSTNKYRRPEAQPPSGSARTAGSIP